VSFLDFQPPTPSEVLSRLRPGPAVLVPLLMTAAFHGTVDIPAVVTEAPPAVAVSVTDVLGPVHGFMPAQLLAALRRRLADTGAGFDALVLAAAGTSNVRARNSIALAARALGSSYGVPCLPAYASAGTPTGGTVVRALTDRGARRVAIASYFLAPGRLYDAVTGSALAAGAVAAAAPLADAPELVSLILNRVSAARHAPALAA
jgi:sirohydrochlorin ferrochelatase